MTLESRAIVVRIDGQGTFVEPAQAKGCGQCGGGGCGAGKVAGLFCNKPRQFQVENPMEAKVGDRVVVAAADGTVMRSIVLLYVFPLVFMLGGAMLGNVINIGISPDAAAAIGALIGLIAGFLLAKWLGSHPDFRQRRVGIVGFWVED